MSADAETGASEIRAQIARMCALSAAQARAAGAEALGSEAILPLPAIVDVDEDSRHPTVPRRSLMRLGCTALSPRTGE